MTVRTVPTTPPELPTAPLLVIPEGTPLPATATPWFVIPEGDLLHQTATPACPHFGPCGGCQLQHLTYPAQLALKAERLRTLLASTDLNLPELQLHPSPPLAYRNRIRLTLAEVDSQIRAGYLTANQHAAVENSQPAFLPITQCPIAAPILWRTTEALLAHLNSISTALRTPPLKLDQLELFTTADESHLQFTLYLRTAARNLPQQLPSAFNALCESLHAAIPELTGASTAILPPATPARSRRNEAPRPGPTWGAPGLLYPVPQNQPAITQSEPSVEQNEPSATQKNIVILSAAKNPRISPLPLPSPLPAPQPATNNLQPATSSSVPQPATHNLQLTTSWVPRGAFFQINRFLIPELLSLVTNARSGTLAFDLYAGVGLFSRALAHTFDRVIAVEAADPAASALAATRLPNLRAIKATTLDFLRSAVVDRDRPDLIILDPPRTGAGPEVCALIARLAPPTLIYVSCSPDTLPADLATLAPAGYTITALHLLDLFPQTTHIETIAILTRA